MERFSWKKTTSIVAVIVVAAGAVIYRYILWPTVLKMNSIFFSFFKKYIVLKFFCVNMIYYMPKINLKLTLNKRIFVLEAV